MAVLTLVIHGRTWRNVILQCGVFLVVAVALGLSVNQLRPGGLVLVADWSPKAQLTMESGDNLAISIDEAEAMFRGRFAVFFDARPRALYDESHIQGAYSLPLDEFESSKVSVPSGILQDAAIITYCDGESCNLSKDLAFALLDRGYVNTRVLVNGWTVWNERNLPVVLSSSDR